MTTAKTEQKGRVFSYMRWSSPGQDLSQGPERWQNPFQVGRLERRIGRRGADVRKILEAEDIKAKAETPADEAYAWFTAEFSEHVHEPEYRGKVRESLHDVVDKIKVELAARRYRVHLKSARMPIDVILGRAGEGWLFSPAPSWVTDSTLDLYRRV